jgi:uncharacterized protein YxjI
MANYPLDLLFKFSIVPQISVTDSTGQQVAYVKQKLFKLKEAISIFSDESQTNILFKIEADRVIDFSAKYNFYDSAGENFGAVKRQGLKSILKAHYDIFDGVNELPTLDIQEENSLVRLADGCLNQIPIVGLFMGYFLNPTYIVTRPDGTPVMRMLKMPAFMEGKFQLQKLADMDKAEEDRVLLSVVMMTLLERTRG